MVASYDIHPPIKDNGTHYGRQTQIRTKTEKKIDRQTDRETVMDRVRVKDKDRDRSRGRGRPDLT